LTIADYDFFQRYFGSGLHKRQTAKQPDLVGTLTSIIKVLPKLQDLLKYGSVTPGKTKNDPPKSLVSETQELKPVDHPQAKRIKIRYGPFRAPPSSEKSEASDLWNTPGLSSAVVFNQKRPCDDRCSILTINSDLEYADGSPANDTNGIWFHHTIIFNTSPTLKEATCGQRFIENIFMSGNEKSSGEYAIPGSPIKSGYSLSPLDRFVFQTQVQNMEDREKWVWQTVTYEYVPGDQAKDYKPSQTVWLTIGERSNPSQTTCLQKQTNPFGASNITDTNVPKARTFREHSKVVRAVGDGLVLKSGGHVHDGATGADVFVNDKIICNSVATYRKGAGGHHHRKRQIKADGDYSKADLEHISDLSMCRWPQGVPLKKGDALYMTANYDFTLHKG
jgi:hypothetical protein